MQRKTMTKSSEVPSLDNMDLHLTSEHTPQEELSDLNKNDNSTKLKRTDSLQKIYSKGINWIVRSFIAIIVFIVVVVTWHHLTSESWRWLDDTDLSKLHIVLFSGAVVSVFTMHLNKNL